MKRSQQGKSESLPEPAPANKPDFSREPTTSSGGLDLTHEQTRPLPDIASLVFAGFLSRHQLSILDVALAAGVRLLTIWRVLHDEPVSESQAQQVYLGLFLLTGVPYRGRIRSRNVDCDLRAPGS